MNLILRIWLLHYIIYYILFAGTVSLISVLYLSKPFGWDSVFAILLSPMAAIFGLYDGLIIAIPVALHYFLKIKLGHRRGYLITGLICYSIIHLYLILVEGFTYNFTNSEEKLRVNNFLIVVPCLFITAFLVLFIFKKRLEVINHQRPRLSSRP